MDTGSSNWGLLWETMGKHHPITVGRRSRTSCVRDGPATSWNRAAVPTNHMAPSGDEPTLVTEVPLLPGRTLLQVIEEQVDPAPGLLETSDVQVWR